MSELKKDPEYGKWLIHFVVGLVYKIGLAERDYLMSHEPHLLPHLDKALEHWGGFGRGKHNAIRPYEHRIFFFEGVDDVGSEIRLLSKYNTYI